MNLRQFSKINKPYIRNKAILPEFKPKSNAGVGLKPHHSSAEWSVQEIMKSTEDHVVWTWGATDPMRNSAIAFQKGEGVFLYDYNGKKYYDITSQAINNNLGYTIPPSVLSAVTK
jgi:4-aminobutyrate aminotransferase-like enzyme